MTGLRQALFAPRTVAILGASDNPKKTTSRPLQYLRRSGWAGEIYPINPFRDTVLGEKSWTGLDALPVVPDHVYVVTDSDAAVEGVRACVELGVPVVSLVANGFNENDDAGRRRADAVREALTGSRTRLLGPSTLGIATPATGFCLTANAAFAELEGSAGGTFVASQSGSMIGALLSRGRAGGTGFSGLVSLGNEIDLTLGEVCELTLDDPAITSYALFLESLRGAESLKRFAAAAAERGLPVMVYKLGRTDAAAELSVGHTGALAGDDRVASAFFDRYAMARVTHLDALLEGQSLARRMPVTDAPRPVRVVAVTTTGGGGAMVIDQLGVGGAELTAPSLALRARLEAMGVNASASPLIDLELSGAQYDVVKSTIELLSDSGEFDLIVGVAGSSARFHPELVVAPIADSADLATPVAAFVVPDAPDAHRMLQAAGVSSFRTPEACADAIVALSRRVRPPSEHAVARTVEHRTVLNEVEGYELIEELGVTTAPSRFFAPDEPIVDPGFPGPYVVKAVSRQLPHKSDAGGVVLGVESIAELEAVREHITASVAAYDPSARIDGLLVQRQLESLGEVIVGYRVDPDVGPVVLVAPGGVTAELRDGGALALAPVTAEQAARMIESVPAFRLLDGYRGARKGDLAALAAVVAAVSRCSTRTSRDVVELEMNPVLVLGDGEGVATVDALVVVGE